MLQLLIVGQFGEFTFYQLTLTVIDVAIRLGRRHQRPENRLAVLFDLRRRQSVNGLRLGLWGCALIGLPIAISLVGQNAQRRETAVGQRLASDLACGFIAHQQTHRTGRQCATARTGQEPAQTSARPTEQTA